jgi:hypothetical protein
MIIWFVAFSGFMAALPIAVGLAHTLNGRLPSKRPDRTVSGIWTTPGGNAGGPPSFPGRSSPAWH